MYPQNPGRELSRVCYLVMEMKKLSFMIRPGGVSTSSSQKSKKSTTTPHFIEAFSKICSAVDEELFRALYYDCAPYQGHQNLPVSGLTQTLPTRANWLKDLAKKDLMAVQTWLCC